MSAAEPSAPMGVSGRLAGAFQANALTPLLALVALLLGLFAVLVTPREEEPQINVTMANVLIPFPGASSADVQQMVARPAEQVLSQIAGIEHTFSVSRPGMALLTVQFKVGVPRTEALVRLYDVLDANQDWLPRDLGALPPIVKPKGIDDVPVLAVTLWARDAIPALDLERVAVTMEAELKRVPGAREVETIGGPGRVVQVALDPARMRARGLDLAQLQQALQSANLGMPAGAVVDGAGPGMLRVETGEFLRGADDVGDLVVGVHDGKPVYLREVAQVQAGAAQPQRYVWFTPGAAASEATGLAAGGAYPAVTLTVTKKPGENAVDVASAVRARVDALHGTVIPQGIEATVTRDYGATAAEKANKLIQKLAFATGSVILLVGLALGRREAVIVGAAVILTLTVDAVRQLGLGLHAQPRLPVRADLLDRHPGRRRHRGGREHPPPPAARAGQAAARDHSGGRRRGRRPDHPGHADRDRRAAADGLRQRADGPVHEPDPDQRQHGHGAVAGDRVHRHALAGAQADEGRTTTAVPAPRRPRAWPCGCRALFTAVLRPLLDSARKRWLLLAGIVAALLLSVGLAAVQWVVLKMLPFDNKSEFQVVLDMPAGTPLEDTAAALQELGGYLAGQPEVRNLQGYAGTRQPDHLQRPGAPVLPARRRRAGRPAGQPGRQAPPQRAEPRDRAAPAAGAAEDRRRPRRAAQGGRSAARPAGAVARSWPRSTGPTRPAASAWPRRSRPRLPTRPTSSASTARCRPTRRAPSCACSASARAAGHPGGR